MTDEQSLRRWRIRHDFMEFWLAEFLVMNGTYATHDNAVDEIRQRCERALVDRGLLYPFSTKDP
jgi:hypothetical protein